MTVVNDDVRLLFRLERDPESPKAVALYLHILDWRCTIAVAKHSEAKKRVSNLLGEEDSTYRGRNASKSVPHTPDHDVLKQRGILAEW